MQLWLSIMFVSLSCISPRYNQDLCLLLHAHESTLSTTFLIAQKYGGEDPHGADPHGDDPHDENHDPGLPANKENKKYKAPKDVYGGDIPNDRSPYPF